MKKAILFFTLMCAATFSPTVFAQANCNKVAGSGNFYPGSYRAFGDNKIQLHWGDDCIKISSDVRSKLNTALGNKSGQGVAIAIFDFDETTAAQTKRKNGNKCYYFGPNDDNAAIDGQYTKSSQCQD